MPVSFAKTRKVKVYEKVRESEKEQVWWTPRDFRKFRSHCMETIRFAKSKTEAQLSTHKYCLRGLEHFPLETYRPRKKMMKDAILLVLAEQECMQHKGVPDAFATARLYGKFAAGSKRRAHEKGLVDEQTQCWQRVEESLHFKTFSGKRPLLCGNSTNPISRSVTEKRRSVQPLLFRTQF
jgi:hypothetical protein